MVKLLAKTKRMAARSKRIAKAAVKKKEREQAAVEYLSIYGWALLIIAAVFAFVLIYVSLPQSIVPSHCTISLGFQCNAVVFGTNTTTHNITIAMAVSNRLSETLESPNLTITYDGVNYTGPCSPTYVPPGASSICVFNIPKKANLGQYVSSPIYITAKDCGLSVNNSCASAPKEVYAGNIQAHATTYVAPNASLTLSANSSSPFEGHKVLITAYLTLFGYPISGGNVNFTVNNPNFTVTPQQELTSSSGYAYSVLYGGTTGTVTITATYASIQKSITFTFEPTTSTTTTTISTSTTTTSSSTTTSTSSTSTDITSSSTTTTGTSTTTVNYAYVVVSASGGPAIQIIQNGASLGYIYPSGTGFPNAYHVAFDPNGKYAWVTDFGNDGPIYVINTTSATEVNTIPNTCYSTGIAFAPNGTLAYVTCGQLQSQSSDDIEVFNALDNGKSGSIKTNYYSGAFNQTAIAVASNGIIAYVTQNTTGGNQNVSAIKLTGTMVNLSKISPYGLNINSFPNPSGVSFNPNGDYAYVTSKGNDGPISVIQTSTSSKVATISSGYYSCDIAVLNSGTSAYVADCANSNGATPELGIISLTNNGETGSVNSYITLGGAPAGVAVAPSNFLSTTSLPPTTIKGGGSTCNSCKLQ